MGIVSVTSPLKVVKTTRGKHNLRLDILVKIHQIDTSYRAIVKNFIRQGGLEFFACMSKTLSYSLKSINRQVWTVPKRDQRMNISIFDKWDNKSPGRILEMSHLIDRMAKNWGLDRRLGLMSKQAVHWRNASFLLFRTFLIYMIFRIIYRAVSSPLRNAMGHDTQFTGKDSRKSK